MSAPARHEPKRWAEAEKIEPSARPELPEQSRFPGQQILEPAASAAFQLARSTRQEQKRWAEAEKIEPSARPELPEQSRFPGQQILEPAASAAFQLARSTRQERWSAVRLLARSYGACARISRRPQAAESCTRSQMRSASREPTARRHYW